MNKNNILVSIFSNWMNLALTVVVAFFVSPILVNKLGDETYGIWVLIISITGYFTLLDFGVNTAIVRYISKYNATKEHSKAVETYSSSFALFSVMSATVIIITAVFAFNFKDLFEIQAFSKRYLFAVFFIVGADLALNLIFSVFMGTLKGLQRFLELNIFSMLTSLIKNAILVYLLYNEYSLLALATLHICANIVQFVLQYILIKTKFSFLKFSFASINKKTLKRLYNYSIYSFLIGVSMQVLYFTDSIVIGSLINVSQVTYYAIPGMIVEYLEKFVWAIIAVLIPIISSQEATGSNEKNKTLYITGTRYSILLISPVIFVLYLAGDDFIGMWMGDRYSGPSGEILRILLTGYLFLLSQLIAHGILKGISKHKVLALLLCGEAVLNLGLSVILAPILGIKGVAIGTIIPLILVNAILIPYFTCKELKIRYITYFYKGLIQPLTILIVPLCIFQTFDFTIDSYIELVTFSTLVALCFFLFSLFFMLENIHKTAVFLIFNRVTRRDLKL
ncbi:MAG: hypothetical protein COA42_22080 [Alteromonadaceae bacterium]|nr:oligosaccharide flippase family protein [Colwellia sp.]PCK02554.1 MAG: hypothetical protein COA42_22080 [Alteromonadaceae bacterium]